MVEKPKKKKMLRGQEAGVFLEDLDSKLDMILEVVKGGDDRAERRFVALESKVDEIKEDLTENIRGIRKILESHDKSLKQHEERIVTLEKITRH
ncbi:MAG TPA: hypothetical protein VFX30_00975 [bacterium]|nr:hypothetical protein [bacterium]